MGESEPSDHRYTTQIRSPPNEAVHADHHWILDLWFSFVHAQLVLEPLDRVTTVTISKTRIGTWLLIAVAR
jgi:hypothetical protein